MFSDVKDRYIVCIFKKNVFNWNYILKETPNANLQT